MPLVICVLQKGRAAWHRLCLCLPPAAHLIETQMRAMMGRNKNNVSYLGEAEEAAQALHKGTPRGAGALICKEPLAGSPDMGGLGSSPANPSHRTPPPRAASAEGHGKHQAQA